MMAIRLDFCATKTRKHAKSLKKRLMVTMTPTEKQIKFVEAITELLGIDFPQSSEEFTKQTYCEFIKKYYDEFYSVIDDMEDFNSEDEMAWFQMLNG
jgi:hypothetical protein